MVAHMLRQGKGGQTPEVMAKYQRDDRLVLSQRAYFEVPLSDVAGSLQTLPPDYALGAARPGQVAATPRLTPSSNHAAIRARAAHGAVGGTPQSRCAGRSSTADLGPRTGWDRENLRAMNPASERLGRGRSPGTGARSSLWLPVLAGSLIRAHKLWTELGTQPRDTGCLCAVIRRPLWGGRGASARADDLTSQHS